MCGSMVDIQSPTAEIRRGKKKKPQGTNITSASATQGGHKQRYEAYCLVRPLLWHIRDSYFTDIPKQMCAKQPNYAYAWPPPIQLFHAWPCARYVGLCVYACRCIYWVRWRKRTNYVDISTCESLRYQTVTYNTAVFPSMPILPT